MPGRFILGIVCFWTVCLFAQGSVSIDSKVDRSTCRIGDLVTYTVTISHTPDITLTKPGLGENLGAFEIRDYKVHDQREEDGRIVEQVDYIISTFETGEFEIPALTFYYSTTGDSTQNELKTQELQITVESLKPSEEGDIKDVKIPLELPPNYAGYIRWGIIAGVALLVFAVAFYYWRKRRAGAGLQEEAAGPSRPAHEIALSELQELVDSDLLEAGQVKTFYVRLSEIIRQYLEGRYFIVALEMTTYEVALKLRQTEIDEKDADDIRSLLENCDLVKFAKHIPDSEDTKADVENAFAIIERTKLVYDAEPIDKEETPEVTDAAESVEADASAPDEQALDKVEKE